MMYQDGRHAERVKMYKYGPSKTRVDPLTAGSNYIQSLFFFISTLSTPYKHGKNKT